MDRRLLAVLALCGTLLVGFLARGLLLSVGRVVLVALALALAGGVAYLVTRQPAYRRSKVGEGTRVLTERVAPTADEHCVECDAAVSDGERRRFVREWVLFGVPLLLLDDGENVYCASCAGEVADVGSVGSADLDVDDADLLREN
jgi:hypothetical protein